MFSVLRRQTLGHHVQVLSRVSSPVICVCVIALALIVEILVVFGLEEPVTHLGPGWWVVGSELEAALQWPFLSGRLSGPAPPCPTAILLVVAVPM